MKREVCGSIFVVDANTVFAVIVGGIKRIGKVASKLVPTMSIFYILGALWVIFANIGQVPQALGLIFSVFPVVGVPTLLCTVVALALRLNLPLIQAVNYAAAPLQWTLILPFLRLGERLVGADPLPLSASELVELAKQGAAAFTADLGMAGLHAAVGWVAVCPLVAFGVYEVARRALERLRPIAASGNAGDAAPWPAP